MRVASGPRLRVQRVPRRQAEQVSGQEAPMLPLNVGIVDRSLRVVLGLVLLLLGFAQGPNTWWGWLGILPLATGLAGHCPLYDMLGVTTRRAGA